MAAFKFKKNDRVRALVSIKAFCGIIDLPIGTPGVVADMTVEKSDGSNWYAVNFKLGTYSSMEEVPERCLGYETPLDDLVNSLEDLI